MKLLLLGSLFFVLGSFLSVRYLKLGYLITGQVVFSASFMLYGVMEVMATDTIWPTGIIFASGGLLMIFTIGEGIHTDGPAPFIKTPNTLENMVKNIAGFGMLDFIHIIAIVLYEIV